MLEKVRIEAIETFQKEKQSDINNEYENKRSTCQIKFSICQLSNARAKDRGTLLQKQDCVPYYI